MNFIGTLLDSRELKYVDWDDKTGKGAQPACDWTLANLVSSLPKGATDNRYHMPVIDIDLRCDLLPSSTSGHYHLYLDRVLTHDQYKKLLEVMVECGLVQQGVLNQFNREGFTCVRLPWVSKADGDLSYPDRKAIDFQEI